jgi:colanic acid/amylovoran biosynthesis glycosyltransferase
LRALGLLDLPIVTTFHGYDLSAAITSGRSGRYAQLFRHGILSLPISEYWAERLRGLGCPADRIVVHHMGIDPERLAFRARSASDNGPVRLISVGRLIEKKGHRFTIQALAALRQRNPGLAFTLDIVGEGPEAADLKAEVARLGVADRVTFHGGLPHDRTLALLDAASIFVLPSVTAASGDMEGIPVSIMEAMAQGLVVVSTFHSGIAELVEDGKSGVLVPERDVPALADAIERILQHPDAWPEYARAGRRKVEAEFDRGKLNAALLEHYRSVATTRPESAA